MYSTPQKLSAEFIGTFALVFFGAGAICAFGFMHEPPGASLFAIAVAHGLAIALMISALGHISGGHFNPAVTIGFWVTKRITTIEAIAYWAAQIAGAIAAAYLLRAVVPDDTWRTAALGTPTLTRDFTVLSGLILEAVTTFFLVLTVFATAVDDRNSSRPYAGFCIGLGFPLFFKGLQRLLPFVPEASVVCPVFPESVFFEIGISELSDWHSADARIVRNPKRVVVAVK
jgi:aquaporin Z